MHFISELNIPWMMSNTHENLETFLFKFKILSMFLLGSMKINQANIKCYFCQDRTTKQAQRLT